MGTGAIRMPNASQMAKWRSYPGTGQSHATSPSCPQGASPKAPNSMYRTMASYMAVRLALPNTMTFSGSSSSSVAMSRFASGMPSSTP